MSEGELPALSPLARQLLAEERLRGPEGAALKLRALERAREALQQDRPSGVALRGAGGSAWPAAARRAPRAVLFVAAAVAVAGLAAAGAGIYSWQSSQVAVRQVEMPRVVAPPALPPVRAPRETPRVVVEAPPPMLPERARASTPSESAAPTSIQTYAIEAGLLEPARRGVASGSYGAAMNAIARHQREYPRGQLAEEREALRVRALWGMGQKPAAESAAAAFRKRYPKSALLGWMKEPGKPEP